MIEIEYQDHGDQRKAEIEAAGWEAVQRCTVFLWTKAVQAVGVANPRPYDQPSKEGEPPRVRTGFGQRNIRYELNEQAGVGRVGVGVNAKYMAMLDQGTKHCRPRPWLLATALKFWGQLQALARGK